MSGIHGHIEWQKETAECREKKSIVNGESEERAAEMKSDKMWDFFMLSWNLNEKSLWIFLLSSSFTISSSEVMQTMDMSLCKHENHNDEGRECDAFPH